MDVFVGTSGFSYRAWKGPFYPSDLPDRDMLAFYSSELRTVEINNTFYRMPRAEVLADWAAKVADGFRFVIKTPQRITHRARLKDTDEAFGYLWKAVLELGERRGPLLVQLAPNFKSDVERLRAFLAGLPEECRVALEFRHASWDESQTHDLLAEYGAAWCMNDPGAGVEGEDAAARPGVELRSTADWGYLRMRGESYEDTELRAWAERVRATGWREAYVFFKHEEAGAAPALARRFAELCKD